MRKEIGPIASPDMIQWAPGLPKTRSGKIMRRILRKIAENDSDQIGDTSTLADPGVVDDLHREPDEQGVRPAGGNSVPSAGCRASRLWDCGINRLQSVSVSRRFPVVFP